MINITIFKQHMKKIIFVEKETAYDPVTAFFNKKPPAPSAPKPAKTTQSTMKPTPPPPDRKNATGPQRAASRPIKDEVTPKIGQKGHYQPPSRSGMRSKEDLRRGTMGRTEARKEESIYATEEKKIHKKVSDNFLEPINKQQFQKEEEIREDSIEKMKEEQPAPKPVKKKAEGEKTQGLNKRIKELEQRQQQYIRKIEQFEAAQEKHVKNQQKLQKLQRQMKQANSKSKEADEVLSKLKEKQDQIKQLLHGNTVPFNRKREIILGNQLRSMKKVNRELTMRLKNYKGSDLADMTAQLNRQQITKDLYSVDVDEEVKGELHTEMESLIAQLANKINEYVERRAKIKGKHLGWAQEKVQLLEMSGLAEKISLTYLERYQVCPLPKSNEEAKKTFSLLEHYKEQNPMQKVMDRLHLNFSLSKENQRQLQHLSQAHQREIQLTRGVKQTKNKEQKQKVTKQLANLYQQRANTCETMLICGIVEVQCLKEWMEKSHSRVKEESARLGRIIGEIRDIVALGPGAKESIYVYLQENMAELESKMPSLKAQVKEIHLEWSQIQEASFVQ